MKVTAKRPQVAMASPSERAGTSGRIEARVATALEQFHLARTTVREHVHKHDHFSLLA